MPGLEGTSLGRYRLKRRLGRGGMAEVYLATDERMQREVAVKVVNSSHAEFAERFSREAQAMGNLHHEHLLPAYDVGEQEPWRYLVMRYIERGTLGDYLKSRQGPLSLEHAGELLRQMASGLQYAHQRGLIHRDIKPSNILLRDEHYIYLADFGLARALEGGSDLTQTGTLLGTPEYMAPELAEGPAGTSADIYALAIVLYQMISGRLPFHGDTAISTFWKQIRETAVPPSFHNPDLPPAVDHVLARALEKDPVLRYPTPLALSQAYDQAISDLDEMPSLYDTEVMEESPETPVVPSTPARTPVQAETLLQTTPPETPRPPAQIDKLFLPGEPGAPASASQERHIHPPILRSSRPEASSPLHQFEQTTDYMPTRKAITRSMSRRRRSNRVIAGIIMGLVFLMIVSGLLAYLTIHSRQQNALSSTATAQAGATGSVLASQTQQVVATHSAQTAVAATATSQVLTGTHNTEATATALTHGTPVLSDPLSGQDSNNWPNDGANCAFQSNLYFVTATDANTLQPCIAAAVPAYSDAAIQVDVTLISVADAGLVFRADASKNQFYDFEVTNQGEFYLRYFKGGQPVFLIQKTASNAIQGVGSKNTLLVIARGDSLQLFINGAFVGKAQDSTFSTGQIGVAAGTLSASTGDASFSNLRVYSLA